MSFVQDGRGHRCGRGRGNRGGRGNENFGKEYCKYKNFSITKRRDIYQQVAQRQKRMTTTYLVHLGTDKRKV